MLTAALEPLYCHCPQAHTAGKEVQRLQNLCPLHIPGYELFLTGWFSRYYYYYYYYYQQLTCMFLTLYREHLTSFLQHLYVVGTIIIPIILGGPAYREVKVIQLVSDTARMNCMTVRAPKR